MSRLPIVQRIDDPSILDLGWGHPDPTLLPVEEIRRGAEAALKRFGADALQYGHVAGPGPLLEWLMARIAANEGRAVDPDEILVTSGISSGLDLALSALTRPGDTVLVESPTYYLAIRILQDRGLDLVTVATDGDGILVEALAQKVAELKRDGRPPRALYTVPTFNNPTGTSLSDPRRTALVELAAQQEFTILEDDVYRELAYDSPPAPSLWSLAPPGTVVRLGSFSKSLAPGLRLGWLTAGVDLVRRLCESGLLDSSGGVNPFTGLVVACLCEAGDFDPHVARLRQAYKSRRDALAEALKRYLPDTFRWRTPGGGFFLWMDLPSGVEAGFLLPLAEASGMSFFPGSRFHADGGGRRNLRLVFTLYPETQLVEAAERLGQAIRSLPAHV